MVCEEFMPDLRPYRLTILLNPQSSRDERGAVESLVKTWVADHQGEVRSLTVEEKRKLAYAIAHQRQTTQVRAVFTAPGEQLRELLERLTRETAVLRTRLWSGEPPSGKRLAEAPDKRSLSKERAPEEKPHGKAKVSLEKLDEKIEEVLKEEVL